MKVIAEDYPSLAEHMSLQIQKAAKTQTEQDPNKHVPRPLIKLQKIRDKEKNFESKQEEKKNVLPMEKQRFKDGRFLIRKYGGQHLEAMAHFQELKEKNCSPKLYIQ